MTRDPALLQIGEAAERAGLSLRTVRHYEAVGLLPPATRSDGGFRLYSASDVERLISIKRMKPFGFSVDEMRELLGLLDRTATAEDARAATRLVQYAERGDDRIERLERDLAEARQLRLKIGERLGGYEATAAQRSAGGTALPGRPVPPRKAAVS